jgi:hypothetical protein
VIAFVIFQVQPGVTVRHDNVSMGHSPLIGILRFLVGIVVKSWGYSTTAYDLQVARPLLLLRLGWSAAGCNIV